MFKTTLSVIAISSVVGLAGPPAHPQGARPSWATSSLPAAGGEKIYTDGKTWFHADHTPVDTHGISSIYDYLCLEENARRFGSVVDVKEGLGRYPPPPSPSYRTWAIQWKNAPTATCEVAFTEREAAIKLIDQRAIEAAEQK